MPNKNFPSSLPCMRKLLIKIWAHGLKPYLSVTLNKLDALSVLVCGALFALLNIAAVSHKWSHEGSALFGLALSVRLFRLVNVFTFYEGHFRLILYTVVDIIPAVANVFFILFAAVYIFAVAATDLFAGVLNPADPVLRNATEAAPWAAYGHELTFDNVPSSLFTLFQVRSTHVHTRHCVCGGGGYSSTRICMRQILYRERLGQPAYSFVGV